MPILDRFRLDGRRAFISGGSRGLGRAIAQALAEAGADLVLAGRDLPTLEKARDGLAPLGRRIAVLQADLSVPEAAEAACTQALRDHGPIDILFNNVGGRRIDVPVETESLDDWRRLIDLNLTSAFVCTRLIGGAMLPRRWGRVVNIASIAGGVAIRGIGGRHYETAKAALVGLTRSVAADWARHGVTVNAIAPGGFRTDPNRRWAAERPDFVRQFEDLTPMGRLGEPEEIAPLALYLASDASSFMTGSVVTIDGGYTAW